MHDSLERLASQFRPQIANVALSCPEILVAAARYELAKKASQDGCKCFGYFPGMQGKTKGLEFDLPHCKKFAQNVPTISIGGRVMEFSFLRISLIKQAGISPYHVDSDASAALTGSIASVSNRLIWRLLLNLSEAHARTLSYLDLDPSAVKLKNNNGYVHYANEHISKNIIRNIVIPPRQNTAVHAVLFCASRVLHAGQDDQHGHFVGGYGCETGA